MISGSELDKGMKDMLIQFVHEKSLGTAVFGIILARKSGHLFLRFPGNHLCQKSRDKAKVTQ